MKWSIRKLRAFPSASTLTERRYNAVPRPYLAGKGIPRERILHEPAATSTVENAKFTKPMLDQIAAKRVILVTSWFHTPRALAIFRKYQPGREFTVSFSPKPEPMTKWDRQTQRRERLAALHNLVVHGVWSF